jgi:hypothetical protein
MRRLLTALSGLVLLSSVVGCHTCGVCDCGSYTPCAGRCCAVSDQPDPGTHVIRVESIKAMPKGDAKE